MKEPDHRHRGLLRPRRERPRRRSATKYAKKIASPHGLNLQSRRRKLPHRHALRMPLCSTAKFVGERSIWVKTRIRLLGASIHLPEMASSLLRQENAPRFRPTVVTVVLP